MSALHAKDLSVLSDLAHTLGRRVLAAELSARAAAVVKQLNTRLWSDKDGIYRDARWSTGEWTPVDPKTGALVLAPTNFYPLLARAANDAQATSMLARHLVNTSEFSVSKDADFGQSLPSISRSDSSHADNSYWRGRNWGKPEKTALASLHKAHTGA